jgi:hypothetical protein
VWFWTLAPLSLFLSHTHMLTICAPRFTLMIPLFSLPPSPPQVLYDLGVVSTKEPFGRLVSQGMILGEVEYTVWRDSEGRPVPEDTPGASPTSVSEQEVDKKGDGYVLKASPTVSCCSCCCFCPSRDAA